MNTRALFTASLFLAFAATSITNAQTAVQQQAPAAQGTAQQSAELTPEQQELRTEIRRLMEMTGQAEMGRQIVGQMVGMFQQQNPSIPAEFWENFMAEVDTNEMVELVIPMYEKHFTKEDIMAMTEFYLSPIGQKMLAAQPLIMQESMAIGQQWGANIAQRAAQKMRESGF
ncbi:MAG: DUF2059 domain-containing protein [Planctomycetota bacterium]